MPHLRQDVRFYPLLRKDVRVRVAYSLYADEGELNSALERFFCYSRKF
jgi:hypothetical protein